MSGIGFRIGQGYDVHAFGEGDHVALGGVRVPHDRGVLAHATQRDMVTFTEGMHVVPLADTETDTAHEAMLSIRNAK